MNNNILYNHNKIAYENVKEMFKSSNISCIVHATGTGKTYIANELIKDNLDKNIMYLVPNNSIIEHVKKILGNNSNKVKLRTYQSLVSLNNDDIEKLDCDILILDEFHHIGAPIWGDRVSRLIDTHSNMKVFGMSAYTVRDRYTSYERDMAEDGGNEIFSDKVASKYDLADAIIDGVLNKPIYKTLVSNLDNMYKDINSKIDKSNISSLEKVDIKNRMNIIKNKIITSDTVEDLLVKNLKKDGKYIFYSEYGESDKEEVIDIQINEIKKILDKHYKNNYVIYKTTSKDEELGKLNRDAFYHDKTVDGCSADNSLKIMFCINQYNEGVHAPGVDGVILGRETKSDIVFFEQIGRALSIRNGNNTPIIIDLKNNIEYIKELETNIRGRIKLKNKNYNNHSKNNTYLENHIIDSEILNIELYDELLEIRDKVVKNTWDEMYNLALNYYNYYGNSDVMYNFKTYDGISYDENGYKLGVWISNQRRYSKLSELSSEKRKKLEKIEFRFENKLMRLTFNEWFNLGKKYYEYYGNLEVDTNFKTLNGIDYNENGYNLFKWLNNQNINYNNNSLSKEKYDKLVSIGYKFWTIKKRISWDDWYNLAKKYYDYYGNLDIKFKFKTKDGINYDNEGYNLGNWIFTCRKSYRNGKLDDNKFKKLLEIGFKLEAKELKDWSSWYKIAEEYFMKHGNLEIPYDYVTEDGHKLGVWIANQRNKYNKGKLCKEKYNNLKKIGFRFENKHAKLSFDEWFDLAKIYFEHHKNLEVPIEFSTTDGYSYDNDGYKLGRWIHNIRNKNRTKNLTENQRLRLESIGMRFSVKNKVLSFDEWYNLASKYYEYYDNLKVNFKFKTKDGINYDEEGYGLGSWIYNQRKKYRENKLSEYEYIKLSAINMVWDVYNNNDNNIQVCDMYGIKHEKFIIEKTPNNLLKAKINYMLEKGIPLMINDELNQIFYMSNINFQTLYGLDYQKLIDKYCVKESVLVKNVSK